MLATPALDPFLVSRYVGFFCVSAVTVIELAIRDILVEFATTKHKVFGAFCDELYERLNGRITLDDLRKTYIKKFGAKYVTKFSKILDEEERRELAEFRRSIKSSYGNLITWRHAYAHQGNLPSNASYLEAKQGFELGKQVLHCLNQAMKR
jgi:hypothetical protein